MVMYVPTEVGKWVCAIRPVGLFTECSARVGDLCHVGCGSCRNSTPSPNSDFVLIERLIGSVCSYLSTSNPSKRRESKGDEFYTSCVIWMSVYRILRPKRRTLCRFDSLGPSAVKTEGDLWWPFFPGEVWYFQNVQNESLLCPQRQWSVQAIIILNYCQDAPQILA